MHRTSHHPGHRLQPRRTTGLLGGASLLALCLGACTTGELQPSTAPNRPSAQTGATAPASSAKPLQASSAAPNAKDYRKDAARHMYAQQKDRVFKGRLPPMLYAIGVLNVDIDRLGQIQALKWTRAPQHAPEVMTEIERMVYAAAPFPAPLRLGKVTYTDVWLWDKSGRFQLDTLTEGQD